MSLKKAKGNMYDWVGFTHSHLGGECLHRCVYCYVDNPRFGRSPRYTGEMRLTENEFNVDYGKGKTIFIEHMNDLFAKDVPNDFIIRILAHCKKYPDNTYVFQTKNPRRFFDFQEEMRGLKTILGCTIETNRDIDGIYKGDVPRVKERMMAMKELTGDKFITIEPVLDFDVDILAKWIADINPKFLNLGADSKNRHLPEPTVEKIMMLVEALKEYGIELREKHNLSRLKAK